MLAVYAGLFAAAVFGFASHELGPTVHSLVGLAVLGMVAWHVTSQRRWIRSAARRRLAHPERMLVGYNGVLAGTFLIVMVSGLPVWIWDLHGVVAQVHDVSGIAFVPLIVGHLILNRRRLAGRLRRTPSRAAVI